MSTAEQLLQAIIATPNDDVPHLIFADGREENGDPHRADFIRMQCRLYNLLTAPTLQRLVSLDLSMNKSIPRKLANKIKKRFPNAC